MNSPHSKPNLCQTTCFRLGLIALLTGTGPLHAATPYVMSGGDYSENFADIANWANGFTGGQGATNWGAVTANSTGAIPDGSKTTVSTATFATSGSSGGVQRGSLSGNVAGTIVLLSTGTTDNSSACAVDLYLDFSGRNAGTLSFDWAEVNNTTGNRAASLKVYTTVDGTTFTELSGATVVVTNNVAASGTISAISLPSVFNGSSVARIRFYNYNGPGVNSPTGSRPKISIDNVAITSTTGSDTQPGIVSVLPASITTNAGSTVAFSVTASGGNLSYFWYKQSGATSNLINSATAATLTLPSVVKADATNYSVVVSNSVGTAVSSYVTLDVTDPAVLVHPQSQIAIIGSNATFNVTAAGTGLGYQWRKDTVNIGGANSASYTRPAVTAADQGGYDVVVTGTYGSVTSAMATLTVSPPQLATWDFNVTNVSFASPPPAIGVGIASVLNGIIPVFFSGSTTDPTGSTNYAWGSQGGYPAASVSNKTAGVEFRVNTSNFKDIKIRWDERHSNSASRYKRFQYTLDGVNFVDDIVLTNATGGTFIARTNDLSTITGVNNNPNFGFRIVIEFENTATGTGAASYVGVSSTYDPSASGGTIRYDMVVVSGNFVSGSPTGQYLAIAPSGGSAVLTWTNSNWTLLASPDVAGPYTNVPGAVSGYSVPAADSQMFFRLTNSAAGP